MKVEVGQVWRVAGVKNSPEYEVTHIYEEPGFAVLQCHGSRICPALHLFDNKPGGYEFVRPRSEGEG